ncbi:O-methyltransferase [Portibacter lacus]|uniref:O-methyltransferase n=1 Tax=Portibacter lacus TaxID=1099794 RepID=A0AA37WCR7_9BACT|nr:O-methyltransferase [Portibacter lacus]GLR16766.1 O-methyltransferase [Portibacter lacus]
MNEEELYEYCVSNGTDLPSYLKELRRETYLKTMRPHMISSPLQGQMLRLLVKLFKSKSILEIGTFTGYATMCLASGLEDDGMVYTIEKKEEFSYFHEKYFERSGLGEKITCYYGDGNEVIQNINTTFDFVFMDAGKKDYKEQLDLLLSKVSKGGVILSDNVLWKGKILEDKKDKMTFHIHEFNEYVKAHPRVENVILPIRDGINIMMVK